MSNLCNQQQRTGNTIAIINQKGGVGKTTITTLLANVFHFHFHLKVAVIDVDSPQYSIYKRRKKMEQAIDSSPTLKKTHDFLYKDRAPIDVIYATLDTIDATLGDAKERYDFIFIDMAGTLNQKGILPLLKNIEHFFIPIFQDADTVRSSIEFHDSLQDFIVPKSEVFKSCHFFFNRTPHMNRISKVIKKLDHRPYLTAVMYAFVVYENSFRNTLFPITANDKSNKKAFDLLITFSKEIISTIYESNVAAQKEVPLSTPLSEHPISQAV